VVVPQWKKNREKKMKKVAAASPDSPLPCSCLCIYTLKILAYGIINMPPERKKMQTQKGSIVSSGWRRREKNNTHTKKGKQETKENSYDDREWESSII
jgi:hypothetical protein